MMKKLYPFQTEALDLLRDGIRGGALRQILCMPTGSGKTVVSTAIVLNSHQKNSRAVFIVDRVALVEQTSREFQEADIFHGIVQGQNTRREYAHIQIASAQTIERRGLAEFDFAIVDECHIQRRGVIKILRDMEIPVIGLSATPFKPQLAEFYQNVVSVRTTNQLIADGFLAPFKPYGGVTIDVDGVKVKKGEWDQHELEQRAKTLLGKMVPQYMEKCEKHFGGPQKFIVFSASVKDGELVKKQFNTAGISCEQISYLDGNDETRAKKIADHRSGKILGLVSCEALQRGYDVPDIKVLIDRRAYRKSLQSVLQMYGRLMRSHPGKEYGLLLDQSGNYVRFSEDIEEFYQHGLTELETCDLEDKVRDKTPVKGVQECHKCGLIMRSYPCLACGYKPKPKRATGIQEDIPEIDVDLVEIGPKKNRVQLPFNRSEAWKQIMGYALIRREGNEARKFALAQYRSMFNAWPKGKWNPENAREDVHPAIKKQIINNVRHWAIKNKYRKGKAA